MTRATNTHTRRSLKVVDLGCCDYDKAWALQKRLHAEVLADPDGPAYFVLVEHPPVITLGRRADRANVLLSRDDLANRGVQVREIDRGGDVTYHGPGQLVAYPIVRLTGKRRDVRGYFRDLEQVVIAVLAEYGLTGAREEGLTGVWVDGEKVCAMGVAIRRWTTYHGIALNVNTDLAQFGLITPCGIVGKGVTSLARLLGRDVPLPDVAEKLVHHFAKEFDYDHVIR